MITLHQQICRVLGITAALVCSGMVSAATPGPTGGDTFQITNDYGTTSDTTLFNSGDFPATSVYTPGVGDCPMGGCTGADDLIGDTVNFTDDGTGMVNVLQNGASNTTTTNGYGSNWQLDLVYHVQGTADFIDCTTCDGVFFNPDGTLDYDGNDVIDTDYISDEGMALPLTRHGTDALVPTFDTSGNSWINVFYNDLMDGMNDNTQVLKLVVTSFDLQGPTVILYAEADFSSFPINTFVEDFFQFTTPVILNGVEYNSFYEIWLAGETYMIPFEVVSVTDFNVTPNLVPMCVDLACATLTRSTDLNVTTRFFKPEGVGVPEPTILALLSMGLLGVGAVSRRGRVRKA